LALSTVDPIRRNVLEGLVSSPSLLLMKSDPNTLMAEEKEYPFTIPHPFCYSETWTGTGLPLQRLQEAADASSWPMGRWPDPILRRPASPVVDLQAATAAARILQQTCRDNKAVGLAAQQCGVDARIVYMEPNWTLVNPLIVERSDERLQRVWTEFCLVLPPTFRATLLRDSWIVVQYQDLQGKTRRRRVEGELARALQHEMDHDRGILVTDHVDLVELENETMRRIESPGHQARMTRAHNRYLTAT